jgi:hypothetical protein
MLTQAARRSLSQAAGATLAGMVADMVAAEMAADMCDETLVPVPPNALPFYLKPNLI